jgi:hypothetical protein
MNYYEISAKNEFDYNIILSNLINKIKVDEEDIKINLNKEVGKSYTCCNT